MDDFGVLVESIGFKAHGKSAPMAKLKSKPQTQYTPNYTPSPADSSSLPVENLDEIFRSSFSLNKTNHPEIVFGHGDVFGGSSNQFGGIGFEPILSGSNSNSMKNVSNLNSVASSGVDYLFGLHVKKSDPVNDDFYGSFVQNPNVEQEKKGSALDGLIPGFEETSFSNNGGNSKTDFFSVSNGQPSRTGSNIDLFSESNGQPSHSTSTVQDDPFLVFESNASQSDSSWPFAGSSEENRSKDSVNISLDDLDKFAMGMGHKDSRADTTRNTNNKPNADPFSNGFQTVDDLDAIIKDSVQKKHVSRPPSTTQDSQFDFFPQERKREVKQTSVARSTGNDFSSIFGDLGPSSGEFEEIDGEPDERRRARLSRHMRTNARVAEALAVKNQRDLQSQHEQEEKHRLSETLDSDIKRWAAGKENNLRALLSSLQLVLWPGCGWRAVSLTEMITSDSVKKVYKKATLYVHPDKVQQKGANLEQKYIAEKVFDLLKEAWNKFSAEELR